MQTTNVQILLLDQGALHVTRPDVRLEDVQLEKISMGLAYAPTLQESVMPTTVTMATKVTRC